MSDLEKRNIAEALILASTEPIPLGRLAKLIPRCTPAKARTLVDELNAEYVAQQRAFEICEIAGGYQMRTHSEYATYLRQLQNTRPLRLSNAALETLAIVAYRQPVTRAEVENVRGVDAGPVMRTLLERKLIKLSGHRDVPGHPMLYATTKRFLEVFGLAQLDDLPTLRELEELVPTADETGDANMTDEAGDGFAIAEADETLAVAADDPRPVITMDAELDASADAGVSLEDVEIPGKPH
ncbi:MAG: SMC-Scp complex subunit ScpB [Deltaproteobacteria bacterium]|jgi:segregation and condensation protein B|nr:SMC-Scp complex subunit ScpB [Deltaproteobacteria bacterium]MBW2541437.1 SMC-Scp complex subunit ScpB [Deltaproteobacteria bacterium]